jgi:hypothetical protein
MIGDQEIIYIFIVMHTIFVVVIHMAEEKIAMLMTKSLRH